MGLDDVAPGLGAALPANGYLRNYVEFGWATTMSPPEFHLAAGLAQMAILMGNRVLLRGPSMKLYPAHLWLALLGPAGAARKTSGINLATDLVDGVMDRPALPTDTTREALWQTLQEQPTGYMVWSEFAGFLAKASHEYMAGIKEDLCEWWDSGAEKRRKLMKNEYVVKWPALTIMAGAVEDRLLELIKEADLHGGFFSRFLFVPQVTSVPHRGIVWRRDERDWLYKQLLNLANHPLFREGGRVEVELPPEERQMWDAYDKSLWGRPETKDPLMSGFYSRFGVQALKLSFCYSLARGSLQPDAEDVAHAISFTEFCRERISTLIHDAESNATREGRDQRKIRKAIAALGGTEVWVPQNEVLRRTRLKARQLEEYLDTLVDTGEVELAEHANGAKPTRMVRLSTGG